MRLYIEGYEWCIFTFEETPQISKTAKYEPTKSEEWVYKFSDLNHNSKCFKRYDWVKHGDPSRLEYFTLFTGAVTMLLRSVLPLSLSLRSPRKAAYGTRDKVPLDSILATVYTVCKWQFLNTWCSSSSTHRWSSDRKAWVSYSQHRIIVLAFQTLTMEEAH